MEVIKTWLINIRDFFWILAFCIYIIPLSIVCKVCGVQLDE